MQIKKFQEGGVAPAAPAAPAQGGQNRAMEQIAQMAGEIIQQLGPEGAAMLAQAIMEMLQGAQQEVGAVPQEQQFMRKGGKICKCGGVAPKAKCGKKLGKKKGC